MENKTELVKLLNQISTLLEGEEERFKHLLEQLKTAINTKSIAREAHNQAQKTSQ